MQRANATVVFLVLTAAAAAFVWLTSGGLPDPVASHFDAMGLANGYMPREDYVPFMLGLVVVLPAIVVFLPTLALNRPNARINLPHRDYWLVPERRAETIRVLRDHMVYIGCFLVIFLADMHWLVVRANQVVPASLPTAWFFGGLVSFGVATLVWALTLIGRFHRIPR